MNYIILISYSTESQVYNLPLPLPPIEEQLIIIKKLDSLLCVCDKIEVQINQNQSHAEQLMQAVLKAAFSHNHEAEPVVEKPSTAANEPG